MSDAPEHPELAASNPYVSPAFPEVKDIPTTNVPSLTMLVVCQVLGILAKLGASYETYTSSELSNTAKLMWLVPDMVYGVTFGLGLALLVHALAHKCFDTLAPGHWRLIASLATFAYYFSAYAALIAGALFFVVVIFRVKESSTWEWFAWATVVAYVVRIGMAVVEPMVGTDLDEILDKLANPGAISSFNPLILVYFAISSLESLVYAVMLGLMISGVIMDQREQVRRDIYHFLGLVLIFAIPHLFWAFRIAISQLAN